MSIMGVYLASAVLTLVVSLLVVAYLRRHLRAILVDLCGTPERANFWAAFSNVTLVLVPLIFSLYHSGQDQVQGTLSLVATLYELTNQLARSLSGLLVSVLALGFVLSAFIPRRRAVATDPGATPAS